MPPASAARVRQDLRLAVGLLLLVGSVYVLSSPGRIDSIDGEVRFDVTRNLLAEGRPVLRDAALQSWAGVPGRNGSFYTGYGAGPSVLSLPMVWLAELAPDPLGERARMFFSWTAAIWGAVGIGLLFGALRLLDCGRRAALGWALVAAFASMLWPSSATVLEQIFHAVLILACVVLAWQSRVRDSLRLAVLAGALAGLLLTFQPPYLLLLPCLALAASEDPLPWRAATPGRRRYFAFLLACGFGAALWLAFNAWRFGSPWDSGRLAADSGHPSPLGNPLLGLAGLLVSPGKSILLYSPTVILGLLGWRGLARRDRPLARCIAVTSVVWVGFVASLSFFHGDWCWGPRYLTQLLPLWALAMPFSLGTPWGKRLRVPLVVAGCAVQLLGLSLVHERFFVERSLPVYFWGDDPGFYFRESALLSRVGEIWRTAKDGIPASAIRFAPSRDPRLVTSYIRGCPTEAHCEEWMKEFRVFYLPRPWPLWVTRAEGDGARPGPLVHPEAVAMLLLLAGAGGAAVVVSGVRREP